MGSMTNRAKDSVLLIFISLVYLFSVTFLVQAIAWISGININLIFGLYLLPLISILIIVWRYSVKLRFPWGEIEYNPVTDFMKSAVTVREDASVRDAENLMDKNRVDFLNVVDKDGKLVGVFTKVDAHKARVERKVNAKIKEVMTKFENTVFCSMNDSIRDALYKISKTKHTRLPILDDRGRPIGIIDVVDLFDLYQE